METYEKGTKDPSFEHIDYGVLALRKSVLEAAPAGQAFGLDSVQHTLSVQGRVRAVVAETRFYEIGTPDGLRDFEAYLGAGEGDLALGNDERLA